MHVWTHIVLFANFSLAAFCKNLLGNIPNPLTIFSKSATLLRSWTSLYLRKWSKDFSDSLVYFFLVLFDFFNICFVDIAGGIDTFGNLIFAVGDTFHSKGQLTKFGQVQLYNVSVNYHFADVALMFSMPACSIFFFLIFVLFHLRRILPVSVFMISLSGIFNTSQLKGNIQQCWFGLLPIQGNRRTGLYLVISFIQTK